jgi:photosystem II stability/assembly factor-like uncharacterized protein
MTRRIRISVLIIVALLSFDPIGAQPLVNGYRPTGLSGGGGLFAPVSMPEHPEIMFVSCDMGGFYRSTDAGKSWSMIDGNIISGTSTHRPCFDPYKDSTVYLFSRGDVMQSSDLGASWSLFLQGPVLASGEYVTCLSRCRLGGVAPFFVGTSTDGYFYYPPTHQWIKAVGPTGSVVRYIETPASAGLLDWLMFIATSQGVWRAYTSDRTTWRSCTNGLPNATLNGFCGYWNPNAGIPGSMFLYCTVSGPANGLYRSTDDGDSWQRAMGEGINEGDEYQFIDMAQNDSLTVYVTNQGTGYWPPKHFTVHKTTDGGATWKYCYQGDPRGAEANIALGWLTYDFNWGWGGPAIGFSVNEQHSDIALFTDTGQMHVTTNGGTDWHQTYATYAPNQGAPTAGKAWSSNGLNVTSVWKHFFDPHDAQRSYLCYTDIGFARSTDRGASWINSSEGSPWRNTFYDLVIDPFMPGLLHAAATNKHDIPQWTAVDATADTYPGGVVRSTDFGATWTSVSTGLPSAPVTSLVRIPMSGVAPFALFCAVYGKGVYRTTNEGASWIDVSNGIRTDNRHVYALHTDKNMNLYALVTANRTGSQFTVVGGLYKSTNFGQSWTSIMNTLHWPIEFAIHPTDPNIIYLTAFDATEGKVQGGVYKTTNGGAQWTRVKQFYNPFSVTLHPDDPNIVYCCTDKGLWKSSDAGATWSETTGPPFRTLTRIFFHPKSAPSAKDSIIVLTFGGGAWTAEIPSVQTAAERTETAPDGIVMGSMYPNPSSGDVVLSFSPEASSTVVVVVYDLYGRLIKSLLNERLQHGKHEVRWNGMDSNGRAAPSGMYFLVLNDGVETVTRKIVVKR